MSHDDAEELDVRGEVCPYPELLTKRRLLTLSPDDVLAVVTDHGAAARNVPDMVEHTGLGEVLSVDAQGRGVYRIVIRRQGEA